jgi:SSS family solute:Na+ symporter
MLQPLDLAIIVGEILLILFVGYWSSRKGDKTARGYFLSSGRMPWWLVGAAFVATSVSSEQIVGSAGAAFQYGMGITNWEWWCLPTYLLVMVFFIPLYLKNRVATVPDLLSRRFGPGCARIYSCVMLFGYIFVFLTAVLYGGSLTFSQLTGLPPWVVLGGLVALVGFYTILGGLDSVMWTDAVQCIMLVIGGLVLFFVALGHIPGGWSAMVKASPERFHLYRPPTDPEAPFLGLVLGTFGVFLFYQSSNQVMIQRVLAARSTWDALMGIVFAGFINLLRPLVTCFLGFVVYHWIYNLGKAPPFPPNGQDQTFPFALRVFAPVGLRGVVLGGFLAAIMASTSALVNSVATIFSLDIYRALNPGASDRRLIFVGRLAAAAALGIACLCAPLVGLVGMFKYIQTGVTYMATPFISVILLGILWKRTNNRGALAGLFGGLIIQIAMALGIWAWGIQIHWLYVGAIAEAMTMIVVIVATLTGGKTPSESSLSLVWKPSLLAQYDDGVRRPWYQRVPLWLGIYAGCWFFVYWIFW